MRPLRGELNDFVELEIGDWKLEIEDWKVEKERSLEQGIEYGVWKNQKAN